MCGDLCCSFAKKAADREILPRRRRRNASYVRPDIADSDQWVVYCKPPFGGPDQVLLYLGAYTHRIAISNYRLVSFNDEKVTFRFRDSADHNKKRLMSLPADEFLRRLLLHVLPRCFVRIRHFGFLASRRRGSLVPLSKQLLADASVSIPACTTTSPEPVSLWTCPICGGPMVLIERLTARQLALRSPPTKVA